MTSRTDMKHTAKPSLTLLLLPLILAGTLLAQSHIPPYHPSFPSQFKHVVVIVQENRTPDNLFQSLRPLCAVPRGASGLASCTPSPVTTRCYNISPCALSNQSGTVVPVALAGIPMKGSTDPDHGHLTYEQMCDPDSSNGDACRNDGAWRIQQSVKGADSYGYVVNSRVTNFNGSHGRLLDPYLTFAEQYGWANFMYQTNQGPSYPAHQFIFSGTSALSLADDAASTFISDNFKNQSEVGCLAPENATATLLSPLLGALGAGCTAYDNNSVQVCPAVNVALSFPSNPVGSFCATKPNMGGALDAKGISWKYYAPSAGSIWTAPNSIQGICVPQFTSDTNPTLECTGTEWTQKVDLRLEGAEVLNDITDCNLPGVSWVIPNGSWSDHAGVTDDYGPSWVAAIINAIGDNPTCTTGTDAGQTFWENTVVVITWDDWGGWADHQPPPLVSDLPCTSSNCQGDYQYGFRVPLIVVSAYTPRGYIDNDSHDFGSILRMIEAIYGIPEGTLGVADARSTTDLSNFFAGPFRAYTPVPALKPARYFLEDAQKDAPTPPDNDGDDD